MDAPLGLRHCLLAELRQPMAEEDVVAQDHRDTVIADELTADDERFREAIRMRLLRIGEAQPEIGSVSKKRLEAGKIARRRNDEDLTNAREHENAQRIVDHRLVVDRQYLLGDGDRHRVESCPAAARQNYSLHLPPPSPSVRPNAAMQLLRCLVG